jgi:homoserine acetyltransferase
VDGLRVIRSRLGHDGFLVERDLVFGLVAETLGLSAAAAA